MLQYSVQYSIVYWRMEMLQYSVQYSIVYWRMEMVQDIRGKETEM